MSSTWAHWKLCYPLAVTKGYPLIRRTILFVRGTYLKKKTITQLICRWSTAVSGTPDVLVRAEWNHLSKSQRSRENIQ